MKTTHLTFVRALLGSATLLALAACSSPDTRYFATEPIPPEGASSAGYAGPPVQVRNVDMPVQLDRAELMREVAPGQFEVREFDHWTAPIGQLARQTLTEDLAARLPSGSVVYPGVSRTDPVAGISVTILSLRFKGDHAVMQVSWTVRSTGSVTPLATGGQETLEAGGGDRSGADLAASISAVLGKLADQIAGGLRIAAASNR